MRDIEIDGDVIRLGQSASVVALNGDPEVRRGRQLQRGDVVAVGERTVRVV